MEEKEIVHRIARHQHPHSKCSIVQNGHLCTRPSVTINLNKFPQGVPNYFKSQIRKAGFQSLDGSCCDICTNHLWEIIRNTLYNYTDKISYAATKKAILLYLQWNGVEDCIVQGLDESFKTGDLQKKYNL